MTRTVVALVALLNVLSGMSVVRAEDVFRERVVPFVNEYCIECHNRKTSEGELDLTKYTSVEMLGEQFRQWEHVISFMKKKEMPPADAKQPTAKLRAEMLKTLGDLLVEEANKLAGDPGPVLPRRLSNAEYDYTIRDLTGVDIQPANSFPVDPASGEGFNNTGEALTMSPGLFKKYYAAAQHVADHVLLMPSGLQFAAYPVVTYADRKKYYEGAIIDFYKQHDVDYEKYLTAVWSFRNRPTDLQDMTIKQWATRKGLGRRYLERLRGILENDSQDEFYPGWLKRQWVAITSQNDAKAVANGIRRLAREIRRLSQMLCVPETRAIVANAGNPPIVHLQRRGRTAQERDAFNDSLLTDTRHLHVEFRDLEKRSEISLWIRVGDPTGNRDGFVTLSELNFSTQAVDRFKVDDAEHNTRFLDVVKKHAPDLQEKMKFGKHPLEVDVAADSVVLASRSLIEIKLPADVFKGEKHIHFHAKATLDSEHSKQGLLRVIALDHEPSDDELMVSTFPLVTPGHAITAKLGKSCAGFCSMFPNRFVYVDETRGLSAGFHLIEGFFRDDLPLRYSVLDDQQMRELDRLWDELEFGTEITEKMLRGFVFFERSERNFMKHPDFDSIKEEDPKLVDEETLTRFRDIYLARSNVKETGRRLMMNSIYRFFTGIRNGLRRRAETLKSAEPIYLKQLEEFAQRAYRRPLTDGEIEGLRSFYSEISRETEYGVEDAVRASIVRLLVSPHFCYRMSPSPEGDSVKSLPGRALASRLSYFLWSSMPDADLRAVAESGRLQDVDILKSQTQRMLKDSKVNAFALEFFGQWLGHRDFLSQESVNRDVFPEFNEELKQAMLDEPTQFITHLIQNDLPVTELLSSDVTFVNGPLAKHYGISVPTYADWIPVNGMRKKGRGGLLGMSVFLTRFSQPERTSPVKRGFWVFHKVLGRHIPAPPADVAVLPAKETDTDGKTIRELLKLHTDDVKCARCHQRFDPIGLAMEGFDPIGRRREKDLAGRAVDNVVHLPNGKEARGVAEFARYLLENRRDEFIDTLCRKFLGYALGRSLLLSDQPLLEKMQTNLSRNDYRFGSLFETVILSPQFRNQRCRDFSTDGFRNQVQGIGR